MIIADRIQHRNQSQGTLTLVPIAPAPVVDPDAARADLATRAWERRREGDAIYYRASRMLLEAAGQHFGVPVFASTLQRIGQRPVLTLSKRRICTVDPTPLDEGPGAFREWVRCPDCGCEMWSGAVLWRGHAATQHDHIPMDHDCAAMAVVAALR